MPPHELRTSKDRVINHYHMNALTGHIEDSNLAQAICRYHERSRRWGHLDGSRPEQLIQQELEIKAANETRAELPDLEKIGEPGYGPNCHGVTFFGGEAWISDDEVPKVLEDEGYKKVTGAAQADDIVVYKERGAIVHSGIVDSVDESGKVTKVRSKFGIGAVWKHHPDDTPYGRDWTVCRKMETGDHCCS